MKVGWQTKTLNQITENLDNKRVPITKADRVNGEYPYYGASGIVDYVAGYIFDCDTLLVSEDGANLLARSTPIAFPASGKYWVNNHAHILKFENMITQRFVEMYLESIPLDRYITGAAQPKLNQMALNSIPIPVAPFFEQQRIVRILGEAFDGITTAKANAEKNLQNARALSESYLQSVFTQGGEGWEQKTLEEISTTFGRGKSKHRPRNDKILYSGKYPFIQTGDIRNAEHFITEYSQTYSEAGLAQSKLWPKGTICITIAANIAETGILGFDACFPDSVIGLVTNPKEAEIGFVEYLLQSFKVRLQAKGKGSAQANINMGTFENERFPFPSVTEQKQIVAKLGILCEETQHLESIYKQKLAALDELKKSLLHQAFSGEL
ncbi:restriction endonuclease subunit S [Methylobacter tundripaludum]|uniref:restriction endonuclease subunit S n=1 Tax=Methylobacter tundripaludum TaxID=173365 RepID=UPI000483DC9F|nr:restriction endonuclease subunit S [Methylobacter tundripaludum]